MTPFDFLCENFITTKNTFFPQTICLNTETRKKMQTKKISIKKDISKKLGQLSRIERSLEMFRIKNFVSKEQHYVRRKTIGRVRQHLTSLLAHYENTYEARKYGYDTVLPDLEQISEAELKLCIESVDEQTSFIKIVNEELERLYLWGTEAQSKKPGPIASVLRLSKLKSIIEKLQIFSTKLKLKIDKQKSLVRYFLSPTALHYMPEKKNWNASTLCLIFERINYESTKNKIPKESTNQKI